jgi:hypothetical protein
LFPLSSAHAQSGAHTTWHFAVSGDSRNCGDVVMPAIANDAAQQHAAFYWHLGDYRAMYRFDQDYAQEHKPKNPDDPMLITAYLMSAWQDFIDNQLEPFGDMPVFLAFGNHELIPPKTRNELIAQFSDWLDAPAIREQRLRDNPHDHTVRGYYHWLRDGIDFITLDNASPDEFDSAQLKWVEALLRRDASDGSVRAVVLGMHEALPESISKGHSMSQSPDGEQSGEAVYHSLLDFRQTSKKPVYILASHSHYYMKGIFNTEYWRTHGGVLPGWIVGTAGAERYPLPPNAGDAQEAKTHVYGYLLATVNADANDPIRFEFRELKESDVPAPVVSRFSQELVHACWIGNPDLH